MRNVGKYVMLCYHKDILLYLRFSQFDAFSRSRSWFDQLCCVYNTVVVCVQYSCAVCTVQKGPSRDHINHSHNKGKLIVFSFS
jgi:hypothetical protein